MNKTNLLCSPNRGYSNFGRKWKVFCAGPIQGAPNWQHQLPEKENITWLSPRRLSYENFNWQEQVDWEHDYLYSADIILMWIPEEIEHIPGRSYAQTTRTEFGEYLARGKKIIFGCYPEFPGRKYFEQKLKEYNSETPCFSTLEDCLCAVYSYIENCEANPRIYFTSDTHFGSDRALELSKRPFKSVSDMDWTMIQKWNDSVHPCDTIYHLGDFGDLWSLNFLNGHINFIQGNYEREGKSKVPEKNIEKDFGLYHLFIQGDFKAILVHEPRTGNRLKGEYGHPVLFGHIHGRQKIKHFGIDVGVDSNNYAPISMEDVKFYLNAIEKGYYDEEVWC